MNEKKKSLSPDFMDLPKLKPKIESIDIPVKPGEEKKILKKALEGIK